LYLWGSVGLTIGAAAWGAFKFYILAMIFGAFATLLPKYVEFRSRMKEFRSKFDHPPFGSPFGCKRKR